MARTATISSPNTARTSRAATQTKQAARKSVDDIKSDMSNLKSRLENLASTGADEGISNVQQIFARLHDRFDEFMDTDFAEQLGVNAAMEKGREKTEEAREKIQENPLQAVLIAAGVGAIVGFLMRR